MPDHQPEENTAATTGRYDNLTDAIAAAASLNNRDGNGWADFTISWSRWGGCKRRHLDAALNAAPGVAAIETPRPSTLSIVTTHVEVIGKWADIRLFLHRLNREINSHSRGCDQ